MNNRKVLAGIAEIIGAGDQLIDFTVALDKLDKICFEGVVKELTQKGFTATAIEKIKPLIELSGTAFERLDQLSAFLSSSPTGLAGIEELRFVTNQLDQIGLKGIHLSIDVTLARGLNYYTGCIFEVAAPEGVKMG